MQYVGGKQKSGGAQIAKFINALGLRSISEPFCGGLSVTYRLNFRQIRASDACQCLIRLYQEFQRGWRPPVSLSREEWLKYKEIQDPNDPMTAFAGFGCSSSGAYFGSYATKYKYSGNKYVEAAFAAAISLENKHKKLKNATFSHCHYAQTEETDCIYADPPYKGTKCYPAVGPFDSDAFWQWVRERISRKTLVFVSEMQAPSDFVPIREFLVQNRIATEAGKWRKEFLYAHESQVRGGWRT